VTATCCFMASRGADCHMARFSEKSAKCNSCSATWKRHEEKETDVHFSLKLVEDAIDDAFDRAILERIPLKLTHILHERGNCNTLGR